ncbi:MAG: helix-turn-helix domain-containing protein, partial [Oscillospiraceae bacterium]
LLSALRERKYNGEVIVISAFQEFEYAKSAIKFGAKNYITKPIGEQELIRSLEEIKAVLDGRRISAFGSGEHEEVNLALRKFAIQHNLVGVCEKLRAFARDNEPEKCQELIGATFKAAEGFLQPGSAARQALYVHLYLTLSELAPDTAPYSTADSFSSASAEKLQDLIVRRFSNSEPPRGAGSITNEIKKHIALHYREDLSLGSIAKLYFMNPVYLGRLFKAQAGESFNEYLNSFRIKQAMKFLEDDRYMVYEIADKVGYQDLNYFYKKFKSVTGMTPREFKQQNK